MKNVIKNPVLNSNPWASKMPNNFRGSKAAISKLPELQPARRNLKSNCGPRRKAARKVQITQNYTDQLAPLYPYLNKSQVKGAITLANNNLHQSRLLLDLTTLFLKMPPLSLVLKVPPNILEASDSASNMSSTYDSLSATYSRYDPGWSTSTATFDSEENNSSSNLAQDESASSSTITENSNSSIFDFSESDWCSEPIQSWSDHKKYMKKKKMVFQ